MPDPISNEYVIHGLPRSLFTRKLQAAFSFYGLPYRVEPRFIGGDDLLGRRAGTHQIPILVTPEGWALADTTPILQLLDARVPACRLFPEGPLGVLVHAVEEILDEWVARVMVHYRWHYLENTIHVIEELLGRRVGEDEARAHPMAQWGPRACRATGTESPAQQRAAEAEYLAILAALEAQLASTPFALGGRPTAVDTILLGGLHAHTNADPIPDLAAFPRVVAWAEGGAAAAASSAGDALAPFPESTALAPFPESTPFARHVLRVGAEQYAAFLLANAEALDAGRKVFEIDTYGAPATYLARRYPEQSRRLLRARIRDQLGTEERRTVSRWLDEVGLSCLLP
jgi:glutathione S-transferase